jgi:hypothetical protein
MIPSDNKFKENLEAIGYFLQATEGLITSALTIVVIGSLMFFNKVNESNKGLFGFLAGGGLLYGTSSAISSRRRGDTNVQAEQAIVQQPLNEDADAYVYNPPSIEASGEKQVYTVSEYNDSP